MAVREADLAEWERLAAAATPGPWRQDPGGRAGARFDDVLADGSNIAEWIEPADAAFIAASRTALPALVAEVRRLREALEQVRGHHPLATGWRDIARAALEGSSK